jgi:predicted transposase/invertase (TIGR01784 family)
MARSNFIMFDWAAKRLLRQKSNFVVLEGFLSTLLGEAIRIERILESEGNREENEDRHNRLDILAKNSRGKLLMIEVQNNRELSYFHRVLYGISRKAITKYIDSGEPYGHVEKAYLVNIVYFDLGQGNDYVYRGYTELRGIHTGDILQLFASQRKQLMYQDTGRLLPEHYVLRVDKFDKDAVTPLDEWISFLKTGDIPEDAKAGGLAEAREQLRQDSPSREEQRAYDAHLEALRYQKSVIQTGIIEGREEGREEGLKEGIEKGIEKGLKLVAERALKNGMSPEAVMELTGLTKEEISSLSL